MTSEKCKNTFLRFFFNLRTSNNRSIKRTLGLIYDKTFKQKIRRDNGLYSVHFLSMPVAYLKY